MALLLYVPLQAHSLDTAQSFEILNGSVAITPGYCPPAMCPQTSARLAGTFNAEIEGDTITFSNININSIPETEFELPQSPNEDGSSTSRSATFDFDGERLVVEGRLDNRAFDGPLYEYTFTARASGALGFDANGYYTARLDLRKCASPMCGGIYVKSVNKRLTRCADGRKREECYIGDTNWEALGFDPFFVNEEIPLFAPILLKGEVIPKIHKYFDDYGEFVATEAYRPATNNQPEGTFVALIYNGVNCITNPCFSVDKHVLNKPSISQISGFDLNPVGASEEDLATADSLFSDHSPLIVAGNNKTQAELHGVGDVFVANQLYLPIKPTKQQCPEGYSLTNDECTTPHGCVAPSIELITVEGSTTVDPVTGEIAVDISYSCVDSCEAPANISGPASCTVELP
jgi:hypothetical protein